MGQRILDPPSVEGWHTGTEWINTAGLVSRINFAVDLFADEDKPGVSYIIGRIRERGNLTPEQLVEACLDMMGGVAPSVRTRRELIEHAGMLGELRFDTEADERESARRIVEMLQLVASTREYQLA